MVFWSPVERTRSRPGCPLPAEPMTTVLPPLSLIWLLIRTSAKARPGIPVTSRIRTRRTEMS